MSVGTGWAKTLYVSADSPAPTAPFSTWSTAARNLQEAADASRAGDLILVTNGVYASGGRVVDPPLTNRVVLPAEVTVRSVHGPELTFIQGSAAPDGGLGDGAVRGVHLGLGAVLDGFTITGGHTLGANEDRARCAGGGVFGLSTDSSALTNCVLRNNAADSGGGAFGVRLIGCRLEENRARFGGGAANSRLDGCRLLANEATESGGGLTGDLAFEGGTRLDSSFARASVLAGNRAGKSGGGASGGTVLDQCTVTGNSAGLRGGGLEETAVARNSIVYFNRAPQHPEYAVGGNGRLQFCCTRPLPSGVGNLDLDPELLSSTHLASSSPCREAGSTESALGTDLDGEPWRSPPSMGADEPQASLPAGPLRLLLRPERPQAVNRQPLEWLGMIEGQASARRWDFGDGAIVTQSSYRPFLAHAWDRPGRYPVTLTAWNADHPAGITATGLVEVIEGVHYVDASNPTPVPPFLTWATAARSIDEAIQVALPGGRVVVTNGVYDAGGRPSWGEMARVLVDRPLRVESVAGPAVTIIRGQPGMRCAELGAGAWLSGFTLAQGQSGIGAGAYCDRTAVVSNCMIVDNRAGSGAGIYGNYGARVSNCRIERNASSGQGGGALGVVLANSLIADNSAGTDGGGAWGSDLLNCTVVGNRAVERAGGIGGGGIRNCIVVHNTSPSGANYAELTDARFSCTSPAPPGPGNFDRDPRLASTFRLATDSPCIGAGSAPDASGLDLDGEPWAEAPCAGADQVVVGNLTGPIEVAIVAEHPRFADGFPAPFRARIEGRVTHHLWDFGDGTFTTNSPWVVHAWNDPGRHEVRLTAFNETAPLGVTASLSVEVLSVSDFKVDAASVNPGFPFATWETAARTIQEAVDACSPGRRVLVTNGVYATGSRRVGTQLNRLAIDRPVIVESVNGPGVTSIVGEPGLRGVHAGRGGVLSGFTVTHGSAQGDGAGIWCEVDALVTNCWITGNQPFQFLGIGGGVYGGTLRRCVLSGNSAPRGGGAAGAVLDECTVTNNFANEGGGAADSTLHRCLISGNQAAYFRGGYGGGASSSDLYDCLVRGNTAHRGGGAVGGRLIHCTVIDNTAGGLWWLEPFGGGILSGQVLNSIVSFNACLDTPNRMHDNHYGGSFSNTCTKPLPQIGAGNLDADPAFADRSNGDLRLRPDSPCIDLGLVLPPPGQTDFAGTPRPLDGNGDGLALPDLGAYEFLRAASDSNDDGIPDGWTYDHGLDPTDPAVASSDPDGDGAATDAEWMADTDPVDATSLFRIEGRWRESLFDVFFLSSSNRVYGLETRPGFEASTWTTVAGQTGVVGSGGRLSLTITNPAQAGFNRVSVRLPAFGR